MMNLEIDSEPEIIDVWKDKHILILADQTYKNTAYSLITSEMFLPLSHNLLFCKDEMILVKNKPVKVTFLSRFFKQYLLKKSGIFNTQYDVILYLGESVRLLRLIEKWSKDKEFVYIGRKVTKRALLHFVPDINSENTATSLINILKKLSL